MTLYQKLPMMPVRKVKDHRAKARPTPMRALPVPLVEVNSIQRIGASGTLN